MGESKIITKVTEFPCLDVRNPEIQRMWALKVIDELLSHIRADSEDESLVKEIVSLGEKYSIVSPYTSFLVLESEEEFKRFGIKRRNLMRI
jgi:Ca-activated chloride channel family protein